MAPIIVPIVVTAIVPVMASSMVSIVVPVMASTIVPVVVSITVPVVVTAIVPVAVPTMVRAIVPIIAPIIVPTIVPAVVSIIVPVIVPAAVPAVSGRPRPAKRPASVLTEISAPVDYCVPKTRRAGRTASKRVAGVFPVSDDNPFGIDTSPEVIERDSVLVADQPSTTQFTPVWRDAEHGVWLYRGNCLTIMDRIAARYPDGVFDMIFADPPYFLSNGGITCHAGRMVSVNKGEWDKSRGPEENHNFNREWLARCQKTLKPDGTIWVSGTAHVIHSVGFAMQQLGFKLLNDITWVKPNPPPNLSCRYFTHTAETIIWAAKSEKSKHHFSYKLMRQTAGGRQMKSFWTEYCRNGLGVPDTWIEKPPSNGEKAHGKHPTQKPVALLERIVLASTKPHDLVLDPFMGSGTTGVAALKHGRRFVGVELEPAFLDVARQRLMDERARPALLLAMH